MNNIRKFLLGFVVFFLCTSLFAESWFVCVGSYGTKANADELASALNKKGIPTYIYEFTKDNGSKLFRVLIDEEFSSRDDARDSRDFLENDAAIKSLRISGLWICQAEKPGAAAKPAPVVKESVIEEVKPVVQEPASEYIKIVLSWNDDVVDLDAAAITSTVFIDYDNPKEAGMQLLTDEETGSKSEIIYINELQDNETYSYYVVDYNNYGIENSADLSYSGATVQIFANGECLSTFSVEPGQIGSTWHVFDITPGCSIQLFDDVDNEELYE